MSRLQIPYDRVLVNPTDFEPQEFDFVFTAHVSLSTGWDFAV